MSCSEAPTTVPARNIPANLATGFGFRIDARIKNKLETLELNKSREAIKTNRLDMRAYFTLHRICTKKDIATNGDKR